VVAKTQIKKTQASEITKDKKKALFKRQAIFRNLHDQKALVSLNNQFRISELHQLLKDSLLFFKLRPIASAKKLKISQKMGKIYFETQN